MNWKKWKQYTQTVCVVYTCVVIWKVILEVLKGVTDVQYGKNLMLMLLITCLATAILNLYEKLQRYPLIPVIIGQYVLVIGIVLGGVFFAEKIGITQVADSGYKDLFISITVPYIVGAIVYYSFFFMEIKRANRMLMKMEE
ncbi:MAG: hypothetical protein PUC12_12245, partial [Clostridiales bacterium]|nr:hypothetical protein [Clostridiales bacterium]